MIDTRSGDAGRESADELKRSGVSAHWWPAFAIDLSPGPNAHAAFARLSGFDCVVFVSGSAVAAVAGMRGQVAWPPAVAIAAVGGATAAAARAALKLPADAPVLAPAQARNGESGSEALWPLLQAAAPRRVLIARAQHGREWLAEKLREAGSEVSSVAVYARVAQPLSPMQRAQLLRWRAAGIRTVTVFSSSEAVDVMLASGADEASEVLRAGMAIATHPRIADRLRHVGVEMIELISAPTASNLLETVGSLEFRAP